MNASTLLRIATALLLAAAIAASLTFLPAADHLTRILDWVRDVGAWGLVFVIPAYIAAPLLFLPGSILTLGIGFGFGVVWGTAAVSVGSTLGATATSVVTVLVTRIAGRALHEAVPLEHEHRAAMAGEANA